MEIRERERERKLMFEKYSNICMLLFYDILEKLKEEIDLLQVVICIKNSKNSSALRKTNYQNPRKKSFLTVDAINLRNIQKCTTFEFINKYR